MWVTVPSGGGMGVIRMVLPTLASCQVATWLGVGGRPERCPREVAGAFRIRLKDRDLGAVGGGGKD